MTAAKTSPTVSLRGHQVERRRWRAEIIAGVLVTMITLVAACGEGVNLEPVLHVEQDSGNGRASAGAQGLAGGAQANQLESTVKLIQNAELHLAVASYGAARSAVDAELAKVGGYLSSANIDHRDGRVSRAVLVFRIPVTSFDSVLKAYSKIGTVVHETLTTQDITDAYFDLEARLENARKLEGRLHEILATQAEELKDLLEVEMELSRVCETIERFEGKLRLWEKQVAFSTLTLELTTTDTYVGGEPASLGGRIKRALSRSLESLVTAGSMFVVVAAALSPWIIALLLIGWLGFRFVRLVGRRKASRIKAPPAVSRVGESDGDR